MTETSSDLPRELPTKPYQIKWCHFSDVHLGYRQYNLYERFKDFGRAFKTVMELSLKEEPDFIIISGDLFETYRPPPDAIRQAIEVLDSAKKANVPVYCIPGNHDLSYAKEHRRRGGILGLLDRLGYLILLRDAPIYHYRDGKAIAQITGIWFQGSSTTARLKEIMTRHANHYENALPLPRILVLHAFLDKMFPSPDIKLADLRALPFDYVALGHHHGYFYDEERLQVFNPGSTEHRSSNEWDTKDWLRGHDFDENQDSTEYSTRNYMVAHLTIDPTKYPDHIIEKNIVSKQFNVRKKTRYIVRLGKVSRNDAFTKMKETVEKVDEPEACIAIKFIGELKDGVPLFNISELTRNAQALYINIDTTYLSPAELPIFVYRNTQPREVYERAIKIRYKINDNNLLSLHVELVEALLELLLEKNDDEDIISLIETYLDKAGNQPLFQLQDSKPNPDDTSKNKTRSSNKAKKVTSTKKATITLEQFSAEK